LWGDEYRLRTLHATDVVVGVVVAVGMRDEHDVGGREVPSESPGIDVDDEAFVAPPQRRLLVPSELVEHYVLPWTLLRRMPMPSISTSTTSPIFMNSFGVRALPMPSGVPVMMMSPGASTHPAESSRRSRGSLNTMWRVFESCFVTPFKRVCTRSPAGSSASALTIHGPSGR